MRNGAFYNLLTHRGFVQTNNGRVKELNQISWNDRKPVYDIRTWMEDHSQYGKGVALTARELEVLRETLRTVM